ncbi:MULTISPECIES: DUF397 domain-containing protein [unclassified Streptomyces]|uniref:DUF397 domain-containing protein n=1 Tax=unclassified Streptomyces TaxID=2593676 RepID=UPI000F44E707|nr:DUF397 domain-containing protein [Streptomyces sp. I6]RNL71696.1 DUF397 domain-containing protein [Streptomyces sp. I6]
MKTSGPAEYGPSAAVRRPSRHGGDGGDGPAAVTWRKSTYSAGDGGDCLEAATGHPGIVPVRDSKDPDGPKLVFRAAAWSAFVDGITADR